MVTEIPLTSDNMQLLLKEDAEAYLRPYLTPDITKVWETAEHTFSLEEDGECLVCCGVAMYWPGRGEAWVLFNSKAKRNFLPIFRRVRDWVDSLPIRRIEAAVDVSSQFAQRHVELLGFELECPRMRGFRIDGLDCALYAKVK